MVEAVLYATENPLSASDIASVLGKGKEEVVRAIKGLTRDYRDRATSLTIVRVGIRYKMQLKNEFSEIVVPVSKREINNTELRILGFVAANAGCKRGDVVQRFGESSRKALENLINRKFLSPEKYRNTEIYSVTKEFYRYFNIGKKELEAKVNKLSEVQNGE